MFYFVRECSCFSLSSYLDVDRCDPAVHVVRSGPPLRCTPAGGRGRDARGAVYSPLFDGFISKYRLATVPSRVANDSHTYTEREEKRCWA